MTFTQGSGSTNDTITVSGGFANSTIGDGTLYVNGIAYTVSSVSGNVLTLNTLGSVTSQTFTATLEESPVTATFDEPAISLLPSKDAITTNLNVSGNTITRTDGRSWVDAGFTVNSSISLGGTGTDTLSDDGTYTIQSISGNVITLTTSVPDTSTESGIATVSFTPTGSDDPGSDVQSLTKVTNLPIALAGGTGVLQSGATYQVVNVDTTNQTFQLEDLNGNLLTLSTSVNDAIKGLGFSGDRPDAAAGRLSPGSGFFAPTVHLTPAAGPQALVYDLTGSLTGGVTYQLAGPGGVSLSTTGAGAGASLSSAYTDSSTAGLVADGTGNSANATANPTTYAYALSSLISAGQDITISSFSALQTSATAKNSSDGLVGVGGASTNSTMTADTEAWVGDSTHVTDVVTGGDFALSATTGDRASGSGTAHAGGLVGVADARTTTVNVNYNTTATLGQHSSVIAAGNASIGATSAVDAESNAYASGLGFGADGHSSANTYVGTNPDNNGVTEALTQAQVASGASLFGNTASISAYVAPVCVGGTGSLCTGGYTVHGLTALSTSKAYGAGFYSEGISYADTEVAATNNVILNGSAAAVTGLEGVDFIADFSNVNTYADSFSRSTGLFGYVNGTATNNTDIYTTGEGDSGALVTAGPRSSSGPLAEPGTTRLAFYLSTDNGGEGGLAGTLSAGSNGHVSKRSLASGGGHDHGDANDGNPPVEHKSIPFSSNVMILSGLPPQVVIDSSGNVQTLVDALVYDSAGTAKAQGSNVDGTTVVVGDITNPGPGNVVFRATSENGNRYTISGSGGTWTFNDALTKVSIVNYSNKILEVNDVRVLSSDQPTVDLGISPDTTLTFHIKATVQPTNVDVENYGTGAVVINGTIDNPIGTTSIHNHVRTGRIKRLARGRDDGAAERLEQRAGPRVATPDSPTAAAFRRLTAATHEPLLADLHGGSQPRDRRQLAEHWHEQRARQRRLRLLGASPNRDELHDRLRQLSYQLDLPRAQPVLHWRAGQVHRRGAWNRDRWPDQRRLLLRHRVRRRQQHLAIDHPRWRRDRADADRRRLDRRPLAAPGGAVQRQLER